jgi:hypothetical protein
MLGLLIAVALAGFVAGTGFGVVITGSLHAAQRCGWAEAARTQTQPYDVAADERWE